MMHFYFSEGKVSNPLQYVWLYLQRKLFCLSEYLTKDCSVTMPN